MPGGLDAYDEVPSPPGGNEELCKGDSVVGRNALTLLAGTLNAERLACLAAFFAALASSRTACLSSALLRAWRPAIWPKRSLLRSR